MQYEASQVGPEGTSAQKTAKSMVKKNSIFTSHFLENQIEFRNNSKDTKGQWSGEYVWAASGLVEARKMAYEASQVGPEGTSAQKTAKSIVKKFDFYKSFSRKQNKISE